MNNSELEGEDVLIGVSAGINSMAVLCWLKETGIKPKVLHLFYSHLREHSPDSVRFVIDGIRFARKHFDNVKVKIIRNSVIEYFESQNMIPHPINSPCSKWLKIIPIQEYCFNNGIKYDLVGYVKHELKRRSERQYSSSQNGFFDAKKVYFIGEFSDEWCFDIVDRNIGWHPAIYDILWTEQDYNDGICSLRDIGKRVFKHNNCLPCKNMYPHELICIEYFYPEYYKQAMELSQRLQKYFGRDKDLFYATFGRELGQESTCSSCKW